MKHRELAPKYQRALAITVPILIVTNLVTAGLFFRSSQVNDPTKAYPFIDIARNYIPQEHFIVNIQPLREQIQKIVGGQPEGTVSVYFEFLNTGANIQMSNDSRFYPASLVKLPTAMVVMHKVEKGEWSLDSRLVLYDQDKDDRYGQLYRQAAGTSFSIEELLKLMLVESDNTAHHILMRNLTAPELDELQEAIGLSDLFNEKNEVSAKEYSRFFRALYNSSFLKRGGSQTILRWLSRTQFKHDLASGLPSGMLFSHKIGEDDVEQNYLDSGIVYLPNRPYLITVMVKQHNQKSAEAIMHDISKAAFGYVESYE